MATFKFREPTSSHVSAKFLDVRKQSMVVVAMAQLPGIAAMGSYS